MGKATFCLGYPKNFKIWGRTLLEAFQLLFFWSNIQVLVLKLLNFWIGGAQSKGSLFPIFAHLCHFSMNMIQVLNYLFFFLVFCNLFIQVKRLSLFSFLGMFIYDFLFHSFQALGFSLFFFLRINFWLSCY